MTKTVDDLDTQWARQFVERAWKVARGLHLLPPPPPDSMEWRMHGRSWDALRAAPLAANGIDPIDPIAKTLFGIPVVCWQRDPAGEHDATLELVIQA